MALIDSGARQTWTDTLSLLAREIAAKPDGLPDHAYRIGGGTDLSDGGLDYWTWENDSITVQEGDGFVMTRSRLFPHADVITGYRRAYTDASGVWRASGLGHRIACDGIVLVPPNQRMDQSGRGHRLSQAGTARRSTVTFPDRAAAPQVMRGR